MVRFYQILIGKSIEESKKRVPETGDVEKDNRFAVMTKLPPGDYLYKFVEGAEAAGQNDESVSPFGKHHLSLMHGIDDVQLCYTGVGDFSFLEESGNDSFDGSAVLHDRICYASHQSNIAAPENKGDSTFGKTFAEFCRCIEILFRALAARTAIDGNGCCHGEEVTVNK